MWTKPFEVIGMAMWVPLTHVKYLAKRGKLSYLTDSVKHYGQIGVNSFIGPYAIDTSAPLNTTRIWIVQ